MTRARRLPPPERRKALIEATLPLLLHHGTAVSTRQIAEAAGVAEGTIFRVFESKDDLIHACLHEALTADTLANRLATIPGDADLADTVTGIVAALRERITSVRTLLGLVHDRPQPHASDSCERPDPAVLRQRVLDAVTDALAPHADALRVEPSLAAAALVALTFGANHSFFGDEALTAPGVVTDLVLYGIGRHA